MADPFVSYMIGVMADAGTPIILENVSRGTYLYQKTDGSGNALFDLANLSVGYGNGDEIIIQQTYGYSLDEGEVLTSQSIFYNQETISVAKIVLTGQIDYASIELSADGGSNWESVTNNVQHTFTNQGQDLRYRITASGGSVTVNDLKITYG